MSNLFDALVVDFDLMERRALDAERMVAALREGLQAIYAARGEDKFIADIASPLIDRSAP